MRHINKTGGGGYHLEQAHQQPPTTQQQAASRWKSFGYKSETTAILASEQYGLCAYSEINPVSVALGTHIEHIQPKSRYPQRTFDYQNLVMSALSDQDLNRMDGDEVFAGHAKKGAYDAHQFVSCLQPGCAQYFVYLSDGRVEPHHSLEDAQIQRAQYTIDLLKLNSPYLVNRRKRWHQELDDLFEQHLNDGYSVESLASIDLLPTSHQLNSFFTMTRQFYGPLAERILATQAPALL